ncbi:MAG: hypothetical protein MJZ20_08845 [Bacteroidaceae bacterium]|nr:hypothetical protein [Bacteroidaceae bacterium]
MKKIKLLALLLVSVLSVNLMAADTWTRVKTIKELTDGGTFIMGYEATAKSGVIIPLRSKDCDATTSANGYFNTGTTANSSTSGTIDMSKVTTTTDYEVYITSPSSGKINIQMKDKDGSFYGATSGGSTKNSGRLYTSGNSAETNLTPEFASEKDNQFKLTAGVSGSYKYLKYNTSSPRFAYYNSAGSNIVFYKKETASDYIITYNLTNVSGDEENPEKTDASGNLELYFYAEDSYSLPENIEVNVGSTTLTSSDYEWEVADEMGLLTLPKAKINGNITITIVGEQACTNEITISKSNTTLPSGCSFELDKTEGCGDNDGETVVVTCSPATHYTVTAVNSESGTPGAISNNKCTISGIKANTIISVTFTEDTKYTITFADNLQHTASIPNTTDNKIVVYENETFDFPVLTDKEAKTTGICEEVHYHFMGWVISTHTGAITAGDIKTGTSAAVTAAATYFAVWAKEEL